MAEDFRPEYPEGAKPPSPQARRSWKFIGIVVGALFLLTVLWNLYLGSNGQVPRKPEVKPAEVAENGPTPEEETSRSLYVTGDVVNVREGPSTANKVITKLRRGNEVKEIDTSGQWVRVEYADDSEGWMHGSYLSPNRTQIQKAQTPAQVDECEYSGKITDSNMLDYLEEILTRYDFTCPSVVRARVIRDYEGQLFVTDCSGYF